MVMATQKTGKRKFKRVAKTKAGVPKKYVKGSKNPKASEREIKRTAKLYRQGKLTPAMMDAISKRRSKSASKKKKVNNKKRK
tara:strand:- start:1166 stop:1411 length:246 start_codon:yes stop_codon:yes gene_type:complete